MHVPKGPQTRHLDPPLLFNYEIVPPNTATDRSIHLFRSYSLTFYLNEKLFSQKFIKIFDPRNKI